ncbi:glycoside-pentoside-hexuronide (GPH):cation symporter, partial [Bifidobacterium magnum]
MQSAAKPTTKNNMDLSRKVAYSFGNVGQSAFYNVLSTYFIVYATSTLFAKTDPALAAKLIGIITGLVVAIRIGEIFLDPLLGNLIDNTNTRFGRFRPWQLAGGIVSAILLVVIFTGLFGLVNVNTTAFMILFVVTFIVLDVFYSIRDISYWGMVPALSSDSKQRSIFTAMASFGGTIGYHGITIIVIPVVSFFTWKFTGTWAEGQSGWTAFAIIAAILAILTSCSVAFGAKESTSELRQKEQKSGSPLDAFKAIAQNDQLLWVALSYLLYAVANVATSGVMFYLFKFVLDMPTSYSLVGVVPIFVGLIAAPLYPVLNRFIPRRYLFLGGTLLMVVAYVIFIMASHNLAVIVTALIFFYTPGVFIQMTAILGLTDSIEYGQLKNGK